MHGVGFQKKIGGVLGETFRSELGKFSYSPRFTGVNRLESSGFRSLTVLPGKPGVK